MNELMKLGDKVMMDKELVLTAKFPEGTLEPVVTLTINGKGANLLIIQEYLATVLLCDIAVKQMKSDGATLENAIECFKQLVELGIRDAWGKDEDG